MRAVVPVARDGAMLLPLMHDGRAMVLALLSDHGPMTVRAMPNHVATMIRPMPNYVAGMVRPMPDHFATMISVMSHTGVPPPHVVVPAPMRVVTRPIGPDVEADDGWSCNDHPHAAALVSRFQIVRRDPATIAAPGHITPAVAAQAAVDGER